jgi:branched-chain amino acid transport system ATP-binding protein
VITALQGVSLRVKQDIVTLIGANGAGKTTTLRTISGLLKARGGEIIYDREHHQSSAPSPRSARAGAGAEGRMALPT